MRKEILILLASLFAFSLSFAQTDCNNAVHIDFADYSTCGSLAMESIDLANASVSTTTPAPTCGSFSGSTQDLWYTITVPAGVNTLAFHMFNSSIMPIPIIGGTSKPGMAIYRGTDCGNLALLDCFSESGSFFGHGEIRFEPISGLIPGETLWIRAWDQDNQDQRIFLIASVIQELPENDCNTPTALSSSGCNILSTGGDIAAPEECGWNSTDNSVFYYFTVTNEDPQPYTITVEGGECWSNEGGILGEDAEIQLAVYSWNGTNCNGIGGNGNTYHGCANGTGSVTYSGNLPLGDYVLAMDGYSGMSGNSLCVFGFEAPFITPGLTASLSTVNAACGQGGSAVITVSASCSGSPTVNWSNGSTGLTVDNLAAGDYTVTITDDAPCEDEVMNFTINDDGSIDVNITTTGICDGPFTATANVTGANPNQCDFAWSTSPIQTTQIATNLTPGTYTVTVTYGACEEIVSTTIVGGSIDVNIGLTGDMCNGPLTATAQVTGADPATCTYLWSNGATSPSINITDEGTYSVQVSAGGCNGSATTSIVFREVNIQLNYIPEICAGTSSVATVVVTEGTPPFSYQWSNGPQTSNININTSGDYSVTVTDGFGCSASEDFTVVVHPGIILNSNLYNITCHGDQNGAIAIHANGGTPPLSYAWSVPPTTDSISNLAAGTYAVTVSDENGCSAFIDGMQISEPNPINFNVGTPASLCFGDSTLLQVNVFGGTPPYSYHWNDTSLNIASRYVTPAQTTTYSVSVVDANNCPTSEKSVNIYVSPEISLSIQTTDANCYNSCDGRAELNIIGGIAPFSIDWETPDSYLNNNLCAGNYSLTVTDNFACSDSITYSIFQPDTLWSETVSYSTICYGSNDGMAVVLGHGGVPIDTINNKPVYHYTWSNGAINDTIIAAGGMYYVTVTDEHGCTTKNQIFIEQPPEIIVTPIHGKQICIGQSVHYTAHATGGDGVYTFTWIGSDGSVKYGEDVTFNPITTTSYTLSVHDNRGCVGETQEITIKVHSPLSILNIESSRDSICPGEKIEVNIDIIGGNGGPYTVHYNYNQVVVDVPHKLYPSRSGYLTYMVTDLCGTPSVADSIYITVHPLPLNAFYADVPRACPPATINFFENSPDIGQTYLWDFGDGNTSIKKNPTHVYNESGYYDVSLTVWSEWGCELKETNTNMIRVWPKPRAEFTATPEVMSILESQVVFTNYSDDADIYFWYFGDGETTVWTDKDPVHTYTVAGDFEITMIARNNYECMDTIVKKIKIYDEVTFYAPTAFSPNGDGINDLFYVLGHGINPNDFMLVIYDRWGNKLFEADKYYPDQPHRMAWDGTNQGSAHKGDKIMPNGVYKWICNFTDINDNPREESGSLYLVR